MHSPESISNFFRFHFLKFGISILFVFAFLSLSSQTSYAATITVSTGGCTLADAITSANNNGEVGSCIGASTGSFSPFTGDFIVLETDAEYKFSASWGDPDGYGNTALPPITSTITISGNNASLIRDESLACPAAASVDDFRFLASYAPTTTSVALNISDLTFINGCANGSTDVAKSGGAILLEKVNFVVTHVTFLENQAFGDGGAAVVIDVVAPTIKNSRFIRNSSDGNGGAVAIISDLNSFLLSGISFSEFVGNQAAAGGAIYAHKSEQINEDYTFGVNLNDSSFISNTSVSDGGAIHWLSTGITPSVYLNMQRVIFQANRSEEGNGGAIYEKIEADGGKQRSQFGIKNGEFVNNESGGNGGAIYRSVEGDSSGRVNIFSTSSVTMTNNLSADSGGGIYTHSSGDVLTVDSSLSVQNTNLVGNQSGGDGGGYYLLDLTHVTDTNSAHYEVSSSMVYTNTAGGSGGGIYISMPDANDKTTLTYMINHNEIVANRSNGGDGGGVYSIFAGDVITNKNVSITSNVIEQNVSSGTGGGVYLSHRPDESRGSTLIMSSDQIVANNAASGAAIYADVDGGYLISNCIVGNQSSGLLYTGAVTMTVQNTWWGAPDGPSGDFSGNGDAAFGLLSLPLASTPGVGCLTFEGNLAFLDEVDPTPPTSLLPGQSVTVTALVTNTGPDFVKNIAYAQVFTTTYGTANSWDGLVKDIAVGESKPLERAFVVSPTITANHLITFSSYLNASISTEDFSALHSFVVEPPSVQFSTETATMTVPGTFVVAIVLDRANPYADSEIELLTSNGGAAASLEPTAVNQTFVIPAGQSNFVANLSIPSLNEGDTFVVTLDAVAGVQLGASTTQTVIFAPTSLETVEQPIQSPSLLIPLIRND